RIVAFAPRACGNRRRRTMGVSPIASTMESNTRPRPGRCTAPGGDDASMEDSFEAKKHWHSVVSGSPDRCASALARNHNSLRCKTLIESNYAKRTHLCCGIVNGNGVVCA